MAPHLTYCRALLVGGLLYVGLLSAAFAAKPRLALVIGNSDYKIAHGYLANARRDAEAVAKHLHDVLGFEVMLRTDIDSKQQLQTAIEDFINQLGGREIGLVYYSGHGAQVDGHNFLIPTQETIDHSYQLEHKAVSVDYLIAGMKEIKPNLSVVILDACRDNPYPKDSKGGSRGLARIDAPSDMIISYATKPGDTAADGDRQHSPYTEALLAHWQADADLPVTDFFNKVGVTVEKSSDGRQSPRLEMSPLHYSYCFRHCNDVSPAAPETRSQASAPPAETPPPPTPPVQATPLTTTANLIADRYRDNGDGTVTDVKTGLQWMRCSMGQTWQNDGCVGEAKAYTWDEAMALAKTVDFAGHADWRLPTREELESLVYCSSGKPKAWNETIDSCEGDYHKPTLVSVAFPNSSKDYWSSSVIGDYAWVVAFNGGNGYFSHNDYAVRLVRSGQ